MPFPVTPASVDLTKCLVQDKSFGYNLTAWEGGADSAGMSGDSNVYSIVSNFIFCCFGGGAVCTGILAPNAPEWSEEGRKKRGEGRRKGTSDDVAGIIDFHSNRQGDKGKANLGLRNADCGMRN